MRPRIIQDGEGLRQTVLGDEEIIKLSGADSNGQFLLIEQHSLPGVGIPMHVHTNEDEVFHVVSGMLNVSIEGREHVLGPGATAFCPRGVPHSWEIVGETKAKVLLMNFPAGLEHMLAKLAEMGDAPDASAVTAICAKFGITFV